MDYSSAPRDFIMFHLSAVGTWRTNMFYKIVPWCLWLLNKYNNLFLYYNISHCALFMIYITKITVFVILYVYNHSVYVIVYCKTCQARSSLYANTQLRAHRRAKKKIKSKKIKKNKE